MTKESKKTKQKQTVYLNRIGYPDTIDLIAQEANRRGIKSLSNMAAMLIDERMGVKRP
jgi:hypothetical protein